MKNKHYIGIVLYIASLTALATPLSCDEKGKNGRKTIVSSSKYESKINVIAESDSLFLANKYLFCLKEDNKRCDSNSNWFKHDEFANYLVSSKQVICSYTFQEIRILNGNEIRDSGFVIYTVD